MFFFKTTILFLLFIANFLTLNSSELNVKKNGPQDLYAHACVNDKSKFIWFRVPKAASCTIRGILAKNLGFRFFDDTFLYDKKKYKDYFKFSFVRNPWARVVSCYIQKVKAHRMKYAFGECFDKDFDYFVDFIARQDLRTADKHIRLQTALVPVKDMNFIGRLENFDEDLIYLGKKLGINIEIIPKKNQTMRQHYSHYYTERTRSIIRRKYKADIKAFGYKFEQIDPPMIPSSPNSKGS